MNWLNTNHDAIGALCSIVTLIIAAITFGIAGWKSVNALQQYSDSLRHKRILQDLELRRKIIEDAKLGEIQRDIGNHDVLLRGALTKANGAPYPCPAGVLNVEEQTKLQYLDNYLNHLETVGMLYRTRWFTTEEVSGFWRYYVVEARDWDILKEYIEREKYGWDDLVRLIRVAESVPRTPL